MSIESIISIFSTLIAPNLHRKNALRADRMAGGVYPEWSEGLPTA